MAQLKARQHNDAATARLLKGGVRRLNRAIDELTSSGALNLIVMHAPDRRRTAAIFRDALAGKCAVALECLLERLRDAQLSEVTRHAADRFLSVDAQLKLGLVRHALNGVDVARNPDVATAFLLGAWLVQIPDEEDQILANEKAIYQGVIDRANGRKGARRRVENTDKRALEAQAALADLERAGEPRPTAVKRVRERVLHGRVSQSQTGRLLNRKVNGGHEPPSRA